MKDMTHLKESTDMWNYEEQLALLGDISVLEKLKQECSRITTQLAQDSDTLDKLSVLGPTRDARRAEAAAIETALDESRRINDKLAKLIQHLKELQKEDAVVQAIIKQVTNENLVFQFYRWKTSFLKYNTFCVLF